MPFEFHYVERDSSSFDANIASATSVPAHKRRYCWGHGVARVLSNAIEKLAAYITDKGRFDGMVGTIRSRLGKAYNKWSPGDSIDMKHAKIFLSDPAFLQSLIDYFIETQVRAPFWPTNRSGGYQSLNLTCTQTVRLLLFSIRCFFLFAYSRWPSACSFAALWRARTALLGIHAANSWSVQPATHYMTNHAIEYAIVDGTAYLTLNEAVEAKNHQDKTEAFYSSHGEFPKAQHLVSWTQCLRHEMLRWALIEALDIDIHDAAIDDNVKDIEQLVEVQQCDLVVPTGINLPQ